MIPRPVRCSAANPYQPVSEDSNCANCTFCIQQNETVLRLQRVAVRAKHALDIQVAAAVEVRRQSEQAGMGLEDELALRQVAARQTQRYIRVRPRQLHNLSHEHATMLSLAAKGHPLSKTFTVNAVDESVPEIHSGTPRFQSAIALNRH